jgi:predicted transposase YdaD
MLLNIEGLTDRREQSNVAASTAILAGLVLEKGLIQRILREDIMRESVIYQEIKAEGRQEGRQEGEVSLILRQLNRRLRQVSPAVAEQIHQLSVEQLEDLGEALLDFVNESDLVNWLENRQTSG